MKKIYVESFAIIVGIVTLLVWVHSLITNFQVCIFFFEPIVWIRIPEIIMGLVVIVIFIGMIGERIKEDLK